MRRLALTAYVLYMALCLSLAAWGCAPPQRDALPPTGECGSLLLVTPSGGG